MADEILGVPPAPTLKHTMLRLALVSSRALLLPARLACRPFSSSATRTVQDILEEKRQYRQGEDLKQYLRDQLDMLGVTTKDSLATMLDKMIRHETAVVIVFDEAKNVVGVATDRDYLKRLHANKKLGANSKAKSDEDTPVTEIMTPKQKLVTVSNSDTAETCMEVMAQNQVRHLPILHKGKLHGVLSYADFLHKPSRFEPEARKAIFAEEGKGIASDDYSFSLTDMESDAMKADLKKRVEAVKNRQL